MIQTYIATRLTTPKSGPILSVYSWLAWDSVTGVGAQASHTSEVVVDLHGNIGIATTNCFGGGTDAAAASVSLTGSVSFNASTIYDLSSNSLDLGADLSSKDPLLPLGPTAGGSLTCGGKATTANGSAGVGAGLSPLDMHGTACSTTVRPFPDWQISWPMPAPG